MSSEYRKKMVHTNKRRETHYKQSLQSYFTSHDTLAEEQLQMSCAADSRRMQEVLQKPSFFKEGNWIFSCIVLFSNFIETKDTFHLKNVKKCSCSLPRTSFLMLLFLNLCIVQVASQDCEFPPQIINILETDPQGTVIFNISSKNRTAVYHYTTTQTWLYNFLNLTFNETDLVYYMRLTQPLDLEEIYYNLSVTDMSYVIKVFCYTLTNKSQDSFIIVQTVNEWPPEFNTSTIELTVYESLPVNSILINLIRWASDRDVGQNVREIKGFSFLPYTGDPQVDGHTWLQMSIVADGVVRLVRSLDYETLPAAKKFITVGVGVEDLGGKSGSASLTVYVEDVDDLPPFFTYHGCGSPCNVTYSVTVSPNVTGLLTGIKPAPIQAQDGDALNYKIEYYIVQGPPRYEQYIDMNKDNGVVTIKQELRGSGFIAFALIVEAREVSPKSHSAVTTLLITVQNGTKDEAIISNSSNSSNDDSTVIAVAAVLSAIIVIVLILLVIMMMYYKKRYKKAVHPEKSITTLPGVPNGSSDQQRNNMKTAGFTGMKLNQNKNFELTLSTDKHGDEEVSLESTPHQNSSQLLNNKKSIDHSSVNNNVFHSSNNDQDEDVEDSVSTLESRIEVSRNQPQNTDTELLKSNSTDQNVGQLKSPSGPTITVLSGLKLADDSKEIGRQTTDDRDDAGSTSKNDLSDAGHSTLSSLSSGSANTESELTPKQVPPKKKRQRKRNKNLRNPEEDVYNGTEIVESVELDSGFYTDSTKTMIRRSSRVPAVTPDPNDTRYWITVNDEF